MTSPASLFAPPAAAAPSRALRAILVAGVIAGALDILYVIVIFAWIRGGSTQRILQGIAAGLLGRDAAVNGGARAAMLGLGLHFVIALGAAATFYLASRKLRFLVEKPILGGLLFGLGVWLFMNVVVQPLSANPPTTFPSGAWITVLIAHFVCVGLPIAFTVRRLER